MKKKKDKKSTLLSVVRLARKLFRFEAVLLLNHGNLIRVIILLLAATYAGVTLLPRKQQQFDAPHRSSAIDTETITALENAIAHKSAERDALPSVNPNVFFQPTPRPTPIPLPEISPTPTPDTPDQSNSE